MIIIGYQGIDKSTYCIKMMDAIDLDDSSCFRDFSGNRPDKWCETYVKTAIYLNGQGYDVFISSNKEVRQALLACHCCSYYRGFKYCAIVPSINLKDAWIRRLRNLYNNSNSTNNLEALNNARFNFEESIKDIANDIDNTFYITNLNNYDIFTLMHNIKNIM